MENNADFAFMPTMPTEDEMLLELSKFSSFRIDRVSFAAVNPYFKYSCFNEEPEFQEKMEALDVMDDILEFNYLAKQLKLIGYLIANVGCYILFGISRH